MKKISIASLMLSVICMFSHAGPIHEAIEVDDLGTIKRLVDSGVSVDVRSEDGETPLMLAATFGNLDIVKYLIEKGADVNAKTNGGLTALHIADTLPIIKILLNNGVNVDVRDEDGKTPLMWASGRDHLDGVKYLVEIKGANVNAKDNYGRTALIEAAGPFLLLDIAKYLLERGADVNAKDNDGKTALMTAAMHGYRNLNFIKVLLEKGADINAMDKNGKTALWYALGRFSDPLFYKKATAELIGEIEFLVSKGAKVDIRGKEGIYKDVTLLNYFSSTLDQKLITFIVDKLGANVNFSNGPNVEDSSFYGCPGDTPAHVVIRQLDEDFTNKDEFEETFIKQFFAALTKPFEKAKNRRIVKAMLEFFITKGANLNAQNDEGYTPIGIAVIIGEKGIVNFLASKSNLNVQDKAGNTILHTIVKSIKKFIKSGKFKSNLEYKRGLAAVLKEALGMIQILIKNGASTEITNQKGKKARDVIESLDHNDLETAWRNRLIKLLGGEVKKMIFKEKIQALFGKKRKKK